MYTSHGDATHDEDAELRADLEALFVESGVDLIFWGHDHFYERTWPVIDAEVQQRGDSENGKVFSGAHAPIHLIVGTAGRGEYDYSDEQPSWSAYREQSYGIVKVSVDITGESLQVDYVRQSGEIGDTFTLRQGDPVPQKEDDSMPAPSVLLTMMAMLMAVMFREPRSHSSSA